MTDRTPHSPKGLTLRSVLLGFGVVALINLWIAYSEYVAHSSRLNLSHFPMALFILFLTIVTILNPLLKTMKQRFALSPSELLVIVAMGFVGGAIPATGLTGNFLGVLSSPYYFATPENKWAELYHPNIPFWAAPTNAGGAMKALYEGLAEGEQIPWPVWIVPLAWWLTLVGGIALVTLCITVILRKQWVEHERLIYALAHVPLVMSEPEDPSDTRRWPPPFMRNRLFLIGFLVGLGIISWNIIRYFVPGFPRLPLASGLHLSAPLYIGRGALGIQTKMNLYMIGFAYFASLEVLFSIWLSYLIFDVQSFAFTRVGYTASIHPHHAILWESIGALCLLTLWGLWVARRHLKDVFLKALNANSPADDSGEMLSYRKAVLGLILGLVFLVAWFRQIGMEYKVGAFFLALTFIMYVGLARIIAESGVVYADYMIFIRDIPLYAIGSENMSGATMTALALSNTLMCYNRGLFMPAFTHAARLVDTIKGNRKMALGALCLGLILGTVVSIVFTLYLAYLYGAYSFNDAPFKWSAPRAFGWMVSHLENPIGPDWNKLTYFGVGGLAVMLLTLLRARLYWWPLHPIGFTIALSQRSRVFSIFLAWLVKSTILKLGGVPLYRRSTPFFLGLLAGYAAGVTVSFFLDLIWFPGEGHGVHRW